jgi:hypothetical protein
MYNHAGLWFTSATDMNVNENERKSRKLMEIKGNSSFVYL